MRTESDPTHKDSKSKILPTKPKHPFSYVFLGPYLLVCPKVPTVSTEQSFITFDFPVVTHWQRNQQRQKYLPESRILGISSDTTTHLNPLLLKWKVHNLDFTIHRRESTLS